MRKEQKNIDLKQLGHTIAVHRMLVGMTQDQVASSVNVTKRHIAGVESGTGLSLDLLFDLVDTLAIPGDEIFRSASRLDPLNQKRTVATNLLLKCNEAQLNITLSLLISMLENIIPGDIRAVAASTDHPEIVEI